MGTAPLAGLDELEPAPCFGEVPVGHPLLDAEGGFPVVLLGLGALDLVLGYPERLVGILRPVGEEDASRIGDQGAG